MDISPTFPLDKSSGRKVPVPSSDVTLSSVRFSDARSSGVPSSDVPSSTVSDSHGGNSYPLSHISISKTEHVFVHQDAPQSPQIDLPYQLSGLGIESILSDYRYRRMHFPWSARSRFHHRYIDRI